MQSHSEFAKLLEAKVEGNSETTKAKITKGPPIYPPDMTKAKKTPEKAAKTQKPPTYDEAMLTKARDDLWKKLSTMKMVKKQPNTRPKLSRKAKKAKAIARQNGNKRHLNTIYEFPELEDEATAKNKTTKEAAAL